MTTWSGTLPSLLAGDIPPATDWAEILGALHALTDAWTSFTPVWTSTGTAPAIVNGTLDGAYLRAGKFVVYTGRFLAGSSTTFGTGVYSMSVPVTSDSGTRHIGTAIALDNSTPANNNDVGVRPDGTTAIRFYGVGGQISNTVPFTWASSDQLLWSIVYAAA
jgi:hypothetical protein